MALDRRSGTNWLRDVVLPRAWVRELDRRAIQEYGIPGPVLMENAGRGATDLLEAQGIHGPVVICCGKGNNAGDAFVVARHLDLRGYRVHLVLAAPGETLTGDAGLNYQIARRAYLPMRIWESNTSDAIVRELFTQAEWIVDGLLGTGATGDPKPPFDELIATINKARDHGAKVFALDLPSGWDCDTGQASSATVRADLTATFAVMKPGFLHPGASGYTGEVDVVDIGVPRQLIEDVLQDYRRSIGQG